MSRLRAAARARLTPGRVLLTAALVGGFLAASAVVQSGGGGAPVDHAARLVPGGAAVYVHATVDTGSGQWKRGVALLDRFPQLVAQERRLLRGLTARGEALDLEHEVDPWLGDEAALALIPDASGHARSLILLEVSDRGLARSFLQRAVGKERRARYRGSEIRSYGPLATAFLGSFLAIGRIDNVRASIDAATGRAPSLFDDPTYRRTSAAIGHRDRLLYAYASRLGLKRVLEPRADLAGRVGRLLDDPELEGVAVTLSAERYGARLRAATALRRRPAGPAGRPFVPRLLKQVSGDAIAYAGARGADTIFRAISAFVGGTSVPLPPDLRELRSYFSGASGRRLAQELRPLLEKETALFVSRSAAVPVTTLVINDVSGSEAETLLGRLQPLLTRILSKPTAAGQVPTFQPQRVGGIDAATLTISPELDLTYANIGGRAVVATSPGGLLRVKAARSHIEDNALFAPGMRQDLKLVTSVLFLDLEQLLALGEQAGLGDAPGFQALRSELAPIKAVSAITRLEGESKTADIFIEVK